MPATLSNTTTTLNLRDTQLGGGSIYASGNILVANNPCRINVISGRSLGEVRETLYPYVSPTTFPLVKGANEYIIAVQFADAIQDGAHHAQVSGWLIEPELAGLGAGNPFTAQVSSQGTLTGVVVPPVGCICQYGGTTDPSGWLICDGRAISRTTFVSLFTVIGTAYGVGDGSTTFNIPDLRGRVAVGLGTNGTVSTLGNNDGVAVANRRAQHQHSAHTHNANGGNGAGGGLIQVVSNVGGSAGGIVATDGGSGVATDPLNAPAYQVVNHIIATG